MASITITTTVNAPIITVWDSWNKPEHIPNWAFASEDWGATPIENDLKTGGKFRTKMFEKKSSQGFEFGGTYTNVIENKTIEYDMDDKRHVKTVFEETPKGVKITQSFDPESINTEKKQREGWQSILNNFKKYTESL